LARSSRPCLNQNPSYRDKIGHPDKLSTALEGPFLQAQRHPHFINAIMQATATDTRPGAKEDVEKFHKIHHGYQTLQQAVMQAAQQSVTPEVLKDCPPMQQHAARRHGPRDPQLYLLQCPVYWPSQLYLF
jgi:hypothetical protein